MRIPMNYRTSDEMVEFSGEGASLADVFFGFMEKEEEPTPSDCGDISIDQDEEDDTSNNFEESKGFWEEQNRFLQATLSRSSSLESRIRRATKEALRELKLVDTFCACERKVTEGCRNCLRRELSDRLRNAGYDSAICKSKWRSSPYIPSGEHSYIDIIDRSFSKKREVRVVIELNFRAEFEMARGSDEYNHLIGHLPEVFVGKSERLRAVIKIMCSAAKMCMKEKKMHMGPWRKQKYMQAKWLGPCERTAGARFSPMEFYVSPRKPRGSMLTSDLLDTLPSMLQTAIKVV